MASKKIITFLFLSLLHLAIVFIFREQYISVALQSMPFRELYSPNLFTPLFYVVPIIVGIILAKEKDINFSKTLCFGIVFAIPNILLVLGGLDSLQYVTQAYLTFFNITLITLGYVIERRPVLFKSNEQEKNQRYWILLFFLLLIIMISFNFVPVVLSKFVVGSDIHYHLALTVGDKGVSQNPYFYEESSTYPPLVYDMVRKLAEITSFSTQDIWRVFYPLLAVLLFIFSFTFTKILTGSYKVAFFTNLFVLPWSQLLITDISTRLFAWVVMMAGLLILSLLLKFNKKSLAIPLLLIGYVLYLSHTLVFLTFGIVLVFFVVLRKLNWRKFLSSVKKDKDYKITGEKIHVAILLFLLVGVLIIIGYVNRSNIGSILIFNEFPVSLFYPFGIISFLLLPLGMIGLLETIKIRSWENDLKIAIFLLMINSLAYFTLFWTAHSRYFAEFGFLALVILAAETFVKLLSEMTSRVKLISVLAIFAIVALSIYPRYEFMENYAVRTQNQIENYQSILQGVTNSTVQDSVVMVDPDDILNRFIPSFTGRYIFGARGEIGKEIQWVVIPGCTTIGKNNLCVERYALSRNFFDYPTEDKLISIKDEYKVDYVILRENQPQKERFIAFLGENVFDDGSYEIYEVP